MKEYRQDMRKNVSLGLISVRFFEHLNNEWLESQYIDETLCI
jgi:hypothetical protein